MLIDRANLTCHVAAKERSRYALNTVALTPQGTVSTDGKMLLRVPYPEQDEESEQDFPVIDGFPEKATGPTGTVLIGTTDAKKAADSIPKKTLKPILKMARLDVSDPALVKIAATDLSAPTVTSIRRVVGAFPATEQRMPDPKTLAVKWCFSPAAMSELCKAIASVRSIRGRTELVGITLELYADEKGKMDGPAVLRGSDGILALLMPVSWHGEPGGELVSKATVVKTTDGHADAEGLS